MFVLNKADLLRKPFAEVNFPEKWKVFVSAKKNLGTTQLRRMLRKVVKKKPVTIGIVGYPNTGKSSLINVLKQRKSAPTSSIAGFTKSLQKLRIEKDMYMLDTPGVFSPEDHDKIKHALTASVSVSQIRDPDLVAMRILERIGKENPQRIVVLYDVPWQEDSALLLEAIAMHFHYLKKGGKPDSDRAARKIIEDWQTGKI